MPTSNNKIDESYKIYHGDNLEFMRGLSSETIDLIYIDPPYFSQRNYGDFDDRWKSMQHYLGFMVERLKEMHRLLKPTGSIYVHLDWHAVHYVKVEMDKIFGYRNFKNDIAWSYKSGGGSKRKFNDKKDTILFYSKSDEYIFNVQYQKVRMKYDYGFSQIRELKGKDDEGFYYLSPCKTVWSDIGINSQNHLTDNNIRNEYATQKPSKLMERIILASSNEGDLVADFFCGSGSFLKKAHELNRVCLGCDINHKAVTLSAPFRLTKD